MPHTLLLKAETKSFVFVYLSTEPHPAQGCAFSKRLLRPHWPSPFPSWSLRIHSSLSLECSCLAVSLSCSFTHSIPISAHLSPPPSGLPCLKEPPLRTPRQPFTISVPSVVSCSDLSLHFLIREASSTRIVNLPILLIGHPSP